MATLVTQVAEAYLTLRALDLTLEISQRTVNSRVQSRRPRASPAGRRRGRDPRPAAGRDAALRRDENDPRHPAPDRAAGELHQHPARTESGPDQARAPPRPADRRPGAAAGPAVGPPHAAAGHPRRPSSNWSPPTRRSASPRRCSIPQVTISGFAGVGRRDDQRLELRAVRDIQRPAGRHPADLQHGPPAGQRRLQRGRGPGKRCCATSRRCSRRCAKCRTPWSSVRKRQEFREQQELLVKALADASQVANMRYEGGVSSYLEVLDTERQLFEAELDLVQAKRDESSSVIAALQGARRRMADRAARHGCRPLNFTSGTMIRAEVGSRFSPAARRDVATGVGLARSAVCHRQRRPPSGSSSASPLSEPPIEPTAVVSAPPSAFWPDNLYGEPKE